HDQAEALALSDQIAVMHGGKLQQYGSPHEVYEKPVNRVVADFMGLVNLISGKVVDARGTAGKIALGQFTLDVTLPAGISVGDSVKVAIRPENIKLAKANGDDRAKVTDRTFLGNISEYYATLDSGQTLRVQTHPSQIFAIDETVAVEIDASHCTVFRSAAAAS